jgi:hypothetical protein
MAAATVPENQVFLFGTSSTIGDLLNVVKALTNAGQKPQLRFVRSYAGEIESVAVDVLQLSDEKPREMAIYTSDPRD